MKIVINKCHGGFGLSEVAVMKYAALKGFPLYKKNCKSGFLNEYYTSERMESSSYFSVSNIERNDPCLVEVVESLGKDADDKLASLKVVEIPDDVQWEIEEYDGSEWISEKHRTWA